MDKGSTLYDYTRSAEELRVFELGEACSKIIHEYEMFNLQNDVYKMFGEWLLNEAKTGYSAVFTSRELNRFLNIRDAQPPRSVDIKAKKGDYDSCEKLRMLSSNYYWSFKSGYEAEYAWYTLWKIAKAYNKQNGCVVTDAPKHEDGCVKIFLNWSKEAQDCISHEAWKSHAQDTFSAGFCFGASLVICLVMDLIAFIILAFFIPDEKLMVPGFWLFVGAFVGAAFLYFRIKKIMIDASMDLYSEGFEAHCNKIEETRYSKYNI